MLKTKLSLIIILILLGAIACYAMAQEKKTIVIEQEISTASAPVTKAASVKPPPLQRIQGEMRVAPLAVDAYVVVKDHGTSQTVMLYSVSENGGMSLVHKARFLYNAPPSPKKVVPRLENTTQVEGKISLSALSIDRFIVVKDHGFGQTSMSYKVGKTNKIKLLNRQSFLY